MKVAIQVPIKARNSTRVANKNFRPLCGKPLCCWLLDELVDHCPADWDIFIDSEHRETFAKLGDRYGERLKFHQRHDWFAGDGANGNHLIHQFAVRHPDYDIYAQAFVTAVTLPGPVIVDAIGQLIDDAGEHDSSLLVTEESGWYWFAGKPLNYQHDIPDGLPRSQDAMVVKETTGLYVIDRETVFKTGCRVGQKPRMVRVKREHALDIDTMEDLAEAQKALADRIRPDDLHHQPDVKLTDARRAG